MLPIVALAVIYVALLFTPIPLPFLREQVQGAVLSALPPSSRLALGDMALALEGGTWPVLRFSPVELTDVKSGAKVGMQALEVGFSPVRAIVGQPGVTVTMVAPRIQINQDLFGPHLANFEIETDPATGMPTVRVLEGEDVTPYVGIRSEGVDVQGQLPGGEPTVMRSDNDWLVYNLEAAQQGLATIVQQAQQGLFSRLVIRDGILEINDKLYQRFRPFYGIKLDLSPGADAGSVTGTFDAEFAGSTMHGTVERLLDADGSARLRADISNFDFASFVPFINDRDAIIAVEGAGAVSMDLAYAADTGELADGTFRVDMTGTELRIEKDLFPIATSIIKVNWAPQDSTFTMEDAQISVGQSSGHVSGVFALGLDALYGPTIRMRVDASDVSLRPYDMAAPEVPFTKMQFTGWSAPLYGAMGIDQFTAEKPGVRLATKGRADMLQAGLGFKMTVAGEGVSADDLKRLWPYFITRETRDWFVKNISQGTITRSTMKYDFPVGTLAGPGEQKPLPPNSISIEMVATGVKMQPVESMDPIAIDGETRLWVKDTKMTLAADGAKVATDAGDIAFANAAMVMGGDVTEDRLIEISGDVQGGIPAIAALVKKQQPGAVDSAKLPIDLDALGGNVALTLVSTVHLDNTGQMAGMDYAINGTIKDFGSTAPIETHKIADGQLSFVASQQGYRIAGQAKVDGLDADVVIEGGAADPAPSILISSTLDVKDLKSVGFDTTEFLSGKVKFVGKPMADGTIQLAVDIKDAGLNIKDLGISKPAGVPGILEAQVKQTGTLTELTRVNLEFGDVSLKGSLDYDLEDGLVSADFSEFALSKGDSSRVALTPIADGYQMKLTGQQFDLKPMLTRFFSLGEGSTGGPQATVFTKKLVLDVKLDRALGFYKSAAFNVDLGITIKGSDLQKVNLQAQLGNGKSISITTNPGPQGKIMSVAFNDLGALLRLVNVYPNLEGGEGSLVLQTVDAGKYDAGVLVLRNFAIADEAKVAEIVGSHDSSQQVLRNDNSLAFRSGRVEFIRRKDRVEVTDGVLTGDMVGGTMRGFIYTDKHQYDLTGTYVPLFGLNNVFQKLPVFGPLLGGREGEGLFGVTFAVKGPLDKPDFRINPMSALAPGLFRGLFEFRAKEQPRVE